MAISIRAGDALACLRAMPADSVHCCVTSPPYWGLRDYGTPPQIWGGDPGCAHQWLVETRKGMSGGTATAKVHIKGSANFQAFGATKHAFCRHCGAWRGSLGLEPDYRLYVDHLVAVLREVRRVLRRDGSLWLVLGDCYASGGGKAKRAGGGAQGDNWQGPATHPNRMPQPGLKPKDLVGIPWRVAFALQDDGWWLRRDNVWNKLNPMPESCKDRCTSAHEYVFHLSKSARYYYDGEAIKEPCASSPSDLRKMAEGLDRIGGKHKTLSDRLVRANSASKIGRKRAVGDSSGRNKRSVWTIATAPFPGAHFATYPPALVEPCILAGCPAGGTVLDPFLGAGTTALVADRLGRHCIGIELSPAYAAMARRRLGAPALAAA